MPLPIVILGAGSAGQALAARIFLNGDRDIRLIDENPKIVAALSASKQIHYDGLFGRGVAHVHAASTNVGDLIPDAAVIIITTTADRHVEVAKALAPHLRDGQIVLLHPGYCFGSMLFHQELVIAKCPAKLTIAEATNTLHLAALTSFNAVFIKAEKQWMQFATHPTGNEGEVLAELSGLLPQLEPCVDSLTAGLNNPNPVVHVPAMVFNAARWGDTTPAMAGSLYFGELINSVVNRVSQQVDQERLEVMEAMDLPGIPLAEFDTRSYPPGSRIENNVPRVGSKLLARFLKEDISCGLIPLAELGRCSSTPTPTIDLLIKASQFIPNDQPHHYRSLERLGFKDSSVNEILAVAKWG